MSKFKMRNRPKKPASPRYVSMNVGNYCSLDYFLDTVKKFRTEYPDIDPKDISIEAKSDACGDCYGAQIELTAPPEARSIYDDKLEEYKAEYKTYEAWRKKNKKEVEKHKAEQRKATAKRKLERTKGRLEKEMEEVKVKLGKS